MGITFFRDAFLAKHGTLVCFTPDDRLLVAAIASRIELVRVADGEIIQTLEDADKDIWSTALSRDGTLLAAGDESGLVHVWRLSDGRRVHKIQAHNGIVHGVSFSPDGQCLATCSTGSTRLFSLSSNDAVRTFLSDVPGARKDDGAVAFHPKDNQFAAAYGDGMVFIWDASPQRQAKQGFFRQRGEPQRSSGPVSRFAIAPGSVSCLAYNPAGDSVAVCVGPAIEVWSLTAQPHRLHHLSGHTGTCTSAAWTLQGKLLLSCGDDKRLHIWRMTDGDNVYTHEDDRRLFSVAATRAGTVIAARHEEAGVLRLDAGSSLQAFLH